MYKLMIVDDSNIIRNRIERSVKNSNFEIIGTATDGRDAVEKFKQWRPQMMTMDLTMPGMDGLECIQAITAIDPDVSILVVSALSDKLTGLVALEYGALGFLYKPFTDEQLVTALTKMAVQTEHRLKGGSGNIKREQPQTPPPASAFEKSNEPPKQEKRGGFGSFFGFRRK